MSYEEFQKEIGRNVWMYVLGLIFMFGAMLVASLAVNKVEYVPIVFWFMGGAIGMLVLFAITVFFIQKRYLNGKL